MRTFILALISVLISNPAYSNQEIDIPEIDVAKLRSKLFPYLSEWGNGIGLTIVFNKDWVHAMAEIKYTKNGVRYVGFKLDPRNTNEDCLTGYYGVEVETIFIVNSQSIRGTIQCLSYRDTLERYYTLTPKTSAGINFIIESLNSNEKITVESELLNFQISSEGFIDEWNRTSNLAL